MTVILTAAGFGNDSKKFMTAIKQAFGDLPQVEKVIRLQWQKSDSFQKFQDVFDEREIEEIIQNLKTHITMIKREYEQVVLISFSTGSLLVEEVLNLYSPSELSGIRHIMLAPAINGSDWATTGNIAKLAALIGAGKVLTSGTNTVFKLLSGFIGYKTLVSLNTDENVVDVLQKRYEENFVSLAPIKRYIFVGLIDNTVREVPDDIDNAEYYYGAYTHSEVGSFDKHNLEKIYFSKKGKATKKEIITRIISDF